MYYQKLFILRKITCAAIFLIASNTCMSQHYIGFSRTDVIVIKGNDYTEKDGTIQYKTPPQVAYGKSFDGVEIFYFNESKMVNKYFMLAVITESELMKIVKTNNESYKKVNAGEKQGFFQWLDTKNGVSLKLESTQMDKVFMVEYIIEKE